MSNTLFLKNVDLNFLNETNSVQGEPILQLPVFLNENIESRQFPFEQLLEKYGFKIDVES